MLLQDDVAMQVFPWLGSSTYPVAQIRQYPLLKYNSQLLAQFEEESLRLYFDPSPIINDLILKLTVFVVSPRVYKILLNLPKLSV